MGDEIHRNHFHTNTPWKVLEYAASLGDIYDVVVENMERQERACRINLREKCRAVEIKNTIYAKIPKKMKIYAVRELLGVSLPVTGCEKRGCYRTDFRSYTECI